MKHPIVEVIHVNNLLSYENCLFGGGVGVGQTHVHIYLDRTYILKPFFLQQKVFRNVHKLVVVVVRGGFFARMTPLRF